jgi:hypothetical protein
MKHNHWIIFLLLTFFAHCTFPVETHGKASQSSKKERRHKKNKKSHDITSAPSKYAPAIVDDSNVTPANIHGLHIATKWRHELDQQALNNPYVSSVTLYAWWMDMNPKKGVYDWTRLDNELNRFVNAGKNVGLMLASGMRSPEWIFQEKIRHFTVVEFKHGGKGKKFSHEQPVVYDRPYIDHFVTFVQAMSEHMKQQPYWNKLTHVSINGINRTTAEFRLPAQSNMEVDGETSTDATDLWKQNGYDPQLVLNAFKEITSVVAKAFPNRYLIVPFINNASGAFPEIGNLSVKEEGLAWLRKTYPHHAAAQYTALTPQFSGSGFVATAKKLGLPVGFELNESKNRLNEDESFFRAGVEKGIEANALYIEIFPENAIRFEQATLDLSQKIHSRKQ